MQNFGSTIELLASVATALGIVVAIIEYRRQNRQQRFELAQQLIQEIDQDPVMSFAVMCLDWAAGTIPVPEDWRAPLSMNSIKPDLDLMYQALRPGLSRSTQANPQALLYRIAFVRLFNHLERIQDLIDRKAVKLQDFSQLGWLSTQLLCWHYADPDKRKDFFVAAIDAWYEKGKILKILIPLFSNIHLIDGSSCENCHKTNSNDIM